MHLNDMLLRLKVLSVFQVLTFLIMFQNETQIDHYQGIRLACRVSHRCAEIRARIIVNFNVSNLSVRFQVFEKF